MITLPPGCTVNYPIWIDVNRLTEDILEWYRLQEGTIFYDRFWDSRGREVNQPYVAFGKSKKCHYHHNGYGGVRLHFLGEDASMASLFILKFSDIIDRHNLQEVMERQQRDLAR